MERLCHTVASPPGMLLYSVALLAGFLVLFKSADLFVIGSVATANNLRISPMIIGLTVVALGTSAPEIFVAVAASLKHQADLVVGNAIGSNIANIGMVLGITAIIVPLQCRPEALKKDIPILIVVSLGAGAVLFDNRLDYWDGALLLTGLALFIARIGMEHRSDASIEVVAEMAEMDEIPQMSTPKAVTMLVLSLVFLLLSAELLVWAVVQIATALGVSELFIGLTVIAIGTSLPELVVCVTSALKDQSDLAIGNIIGSNIFNILAVLSIPSLLAPQGFSHDIFLRDYGTMMGMTLLLVLMAYGLLGRARITRLEGVVLVACWAGYLFALYHFAMRL